MKEKYYFKINFHIIQKVLKNLKIDLDKNNFPTYIQLIQKDRKIFIQMYNLYYIQN